MKERRNKLNIQEGQTETFHYEPTGGVTQKDGVRRVAAYCRVSTLAEEQELSFETQSAYYKGLIEKDPTMVLVGIYGDQGFSGLHASRRKEFLRLITDCEANKVDMVLVKSISRFSRNTVECREYLERLKKHGVAVLFEKEGLNSMDPQTDMILSIYSSMAQSESCSHSENIRWAKQRRAELGDPIRMACYGYRIQKKPGDAYRYWVIQEEEAERVRYLFSLAYQGYAMKEIREMLNNREAAAGREAWTRDRIQMVLRNEAYRGDILTNKTVVLDYLTKKSVRNQGQVE
ncbi:MAG: recombinase family protein, partial [Firmicutes bacterium]|nr:recombinase family protein [Bacillota bacterium]